MPNKIINSNNNKNNDTRIIEKNDKPEKRNNDTSNIDKDYENIIKKLSKI